MALDELLPFREDIDRLNREILSLLSKRGELVTIIGRFKRMHGLDFYDPGREREMIDALVGSNEGPFPNETIRRIFEEIFKASRELQKAEGS